MITAGNEGIVYAGAANARISELEAENAALKAQVEEAEGRAQGFQQTYENALTGNRILLERETAANARADAATKVADAALAYVEATPLQEVKPRVEAWKLLLIALSEYRKAAALQDGKEGECADSLATR